VKAQVLQQDDLVGRNRRELFDLPMQSRQMPVGIVCFAGRRAPVPGYLGSLFPLGRRVRSDQNHFARVNKLQRGQRAIDAVRFADLVVMEGTL
jgi:hypothetical protein